MSGAPTFPASAIRYDWERFWIEQSGLLDLSDAGFLLDSSEHLSSHSDLKRLEELEQIPALALLGEPGIGKSSTLKLEHERIMALADEMHRSDYLDLGTSSNEDWLCRKIFESPTVIAWKERGGHLTLHLDSLDEAMLRVETISHRLADGIRSLPADRLSIRIACRTAVWPAYSLGLTLQEIWGEPPDSE